MATSKPVPVAMQSEGAIDFVEPLPKDFECPLCLGVLRDPLLTSCGHHYCKTCIERVVQANSPCPVCKEENIQVFPDASVRRKVGGLQVRCRLKSRGCEWVGELSSLDRHLGVGGDCQCVMIHCEFSDMGCTTCLPRKDIAQHNEGSLYKHLMLMAIRGARGVVGEGCSEENVSEKQADLERRADLIQLQLQGKDDRMKWELAEAKAELYKKDGQIQSLTERLQNVEKKEDQMKQLQEQIQQLTEREDRMKQQIQSLTGRLQNTESKVSQLLNLPPFEFEMTEFSKHKADDDTWYSPPFYSDRGGYKQCLAVHANGKGLYRGTHFTWELHTMMGEYDDVLHWPRELPTAVEICRRDSNTWVDPWGLCQAHKRPKPTAAMVLSGCPHYTENQDLPKYLKNDCIRFRIKSVTSK